MPGADGDRLTAARIAAVTRRHARGGALTGEQEAAALAELAEVADGRVDLLAQQAGLAVGFHEHDIDAPIYLQIAQLCIKQAQTPRSSRAGSRKDDDERRPPSRSRSLG